ncbi:MAG: hypothetical protein GX567_05800 [Clostridia bacterium]|nr:hypothetical protein [Clostridia bacterium]
MDDILSGLLGIVQDILSTAFDGLFSIIYHFIFNVSSGSFSVTGENIFSSISDHISISNPSFDSVFFVVGFGFFIFILKHAITFVCDVIDFF